MIRICALAAGLLVTAWTIAGCGQSEGVLLVLSADGTWNSEQQVAESLARIELLFDADGGFLAGADGQLVDPDGDGQDELLVSLAVSGRRTLPSVRVRADRSAGQAMAVRVRGLDEQDRVVAYGGVPAQALFAGAGQISVPLDLRRSQRPAFVLALSPNSVPAGSSLGALALFASRPLQADSLRAAAQVLLDGTPVTGRWAQRDGCPDGAQMWTFSPDSCLAAAGGTARIQVSLADGVLDEAGEAVAAFSQTLDLELVEFGACQPLTGCSAFSSGVARPDLRCDLASGLFTPAACTNAPGSCLGERNAYGIVAVTDPQACPLYRPGAEEVGGQCVIMDAWPCVRQSDCRDVGVFECDPVSDTCRPDSCLDSCPTPGQVCVPDWGCQPGLGACLEPCAAYGGCPDFSQTCRLGDDGLWACRD